jgi:hypothetical protein
MQLEQILWLHSRPRQIHIARLVAGVDQATIWTALPWRQDLTEREAVHLKQEKGKRYYRK